MTRNANGQTIKLFTDIGVFDSEADYQRELWRRSIAAERRHQIEDWGYDADHDRSEGVDHLLTWAQEYARIGKTLECAALIEAARDLIATSSSLETDRA